MKNNDKPRLIHWPSQASKSKLKYLAHGFQLLEIPIIVSKDLDKGIIDSQIYPIVFEFGDGQRKKAWFDITASRHKTHFDLLERDKNSIYFKTHLAQAHRKKDPRILPMPQAVSNMQYLRIYQQLRKERIGRKKFEYDVLALFVNSDAGLRQKVVQKLRAMDGIKSLAWMIEHPQLERPKVPPQLLGPKLRYAQHLSLQSRTKICIALPGAWKNGGASISFRHSEIWGMGGIVASIRPGTFMIGDPHSCWIQFNMDLSNFEEKIREYVRNDKSREKLSKDGARYWDSVHHPIKAAQYMIDKINKFKQED